MDCSTRFLAPFPQPSNGNDAQRGWTARGHRYSDLGGNIPVEGTPKIEVSRVGHFLLPKA